MPAVKRKVSACGCKQRPSPMAMFKAVRTSKVPEGGWTMEAYQGTANGRRLNRDMQKVRNLAVGKGMRKLIKPLAAIMRGQVERVCNIAEQRIERSFGTQSFAEQLANSLAGLLTPDAPAQVPLLHAAKVRIPATVGETFLMEALDAVFGPDENAAIMRTVSPAMNSVAADVMDKTSDLLGATLHPGSRRALHTRINEMAQEVTNINNTTRRRLAQTITNGIAEGKHPIEVIADVRKRIPQIATNRVPTIVRTEMGRAADAASVRAMRDSTVVTHVSVTGCEAIEPGIPTFRGVPTCNIKNVPIEYAGDLRFHINHTGAIIATGFKSALGRNPNLPLREGPGAGTFEDRGGSQVNEPPPKPPAGAQPPPPASGPAPAPASEPPRPRPPARDSRGFPVSLDNFDDEFEDLGAAGGSTGARFVKDKSTGTVFVKKHALGARAPHLREEFQADTLYAKAGANVPEMRLFETAEGAVKLSKKLDGVTLNKFLDTATAEQIADVKRQAQKHLHIDALLSNWDVVGLENDNLFISGGKVYRLDNGGALRFRAQGAAKGAAFTEDSVTELWTLRGRKAIAGDIPINRTAEAVFKDMKAFDLADNIRKTDFAALIEDVSDPALRTTLAKRAKELVEFGNRGAHYEHHGIRDAFFDDIGYNMELLKAAGVKARLPKELMPNVSPTSWLDEKGREFDDLRGARANALEQVLIDVCARATGLRSSEVNSVLSGWGNSQAGSSWDGLAVKFKAWLASSKYTDDIVNASYDMDGMVKKAADDWWDVIPDARKEVIHECWSIQQAALQMILENTKLAHVDRDRKVMRLFRTEDFKVLVNHGGNPSKGQISTHAKGLNESHSTQKLVSVSGYEVTEQAVPLCRVNGHYMMGGQGSNGTFFACDGENEVSVTGTGVPSKFHGSRPGWGQRKTHPLTEVQLNQIMKREHSLQDWEANSDAHLLPSRVDNEAEMQKVSLAKYF
jgi:hypothetical protein